MATKKLDTRFVKAFQAAKISTSDRAAGQAVYTTLQKVADKVTFEQLAQEETYTFAQRIGVEINGENLAALAKLKAATQKVIEEGPVEEEASPRESDEGSEGEKHLFVHIPERPSEMSEETLLAGLKKSKRDRTLRREFLGRPIVKLALNVQPNIIAVRLLGGTKMEILVDETMENIESLGKANAQPRGEFRGHQLVELDVALALAKIHLKHPVLKNTTTEGKWDDAHSLNWEFLPDRIWEALVWNREESQTPNRFWSGPIEIYTVYNTLSQANLEEDMEVEKIPVPFRSMVAAYDLAKSTQGVRVNLVVIGGGQSASDSFHRTTF